MATNPQLILSQGKFDIESPEYQQFKRQNITKWGITSQVMMHVERHLAPYNINVVYVDVQGMLNLADQDLERYTVEDILSIITNRVQV